MFVVMSQNVDLSLTGPSTAPGATASGETDAAGTASDFCDRRLLRGRPSLSLGGCSREETWMKLLPVSITCLKVKPV